MPARKDTPTLSKSKLLAAHQCPKRLYLAWHSPELATPSEKRESAFKTGHEVGGIAKKIYGAADSVEVEYRPADMSAMVEETAGLIDGGAKSPIFEATFRHEGVLVRVDVLIPDGDSWRAIEIKASTQVKPQYKLDCAIQWWVMRGAGVPVKSIALGFVNNQFVYGGDDEYSGLIAEEDLTEEAQTLSGVVVQLIADARGAVSGDLPDVPVGAQCGKPYECEFRAHCWPLDTEFPVPGIGGAKAKHAEWINRGITDLREIPADEIDNKKQRRIHRVTCGGSAEVLDEAKEILQALDHPRYFLDFETIGPAVPFWNGMRPYRAVPIQWSVHIDEGDGDGSVASLRHEEFLDLSGDPPMRPLAERMIECLGDCGPVLMYTSYERGVIKTLIEFFPDLQPPLQKIIDRLFDLQPVVAQCYYHPRMLGSWSIKAVAPAIASHLDYANLEGIQEGTAASDAYLEAINPGTMPERKVELEEQLLRYCRFDTEVMVEIVRFLCR